MCRRMFGRTGPSMTHRDYIASCGTWDALMELERLGLPIRDKDGDFDGADTKDADSSILKSYDYTAMNSIKLRGGSARAMQQCCGEVLTKPVLEFGLNWLRSIRNTEAKKTYARNPHELARVMEAYFIRTRFGLWFVCRS